MKKEITNHGEQIEFLCKIHWANTSQVYEFTEKNIEDTGQKMHYTCIKDSNNNHIIERGKYGEHKDAVIAVWGDKEFILEKVFIEDGGYLKGEIIWGSTTDISDEFTLMGIEKFKPKYERL